MEKLLEFIDGRKTTILAIASAICAYTVASGLITAELGALIQTIISIIAGGAVIASNRVLGRGYRSKNV